MTYWERAKAQIEAHKEQAFNINFELAAHPEISGQEEQSARYISSILEGAGIPISRELSGVTHSFRGQVIKGDTTTGLMIHGRKGLRRPRLAILCEYDALPNIGHGCGHCASGSISTLAALTLKGLDAALKAEGAEGLPMDVDIIGTPDEEATGGKVDLVKAGEFDEYDFAIMVHMDGVESRANSAFLALDCYRIE